MEVLGLLFLGFILWLFLKIIAAVFSAGVFLLTIPFKILGALLFLVVLLPITVAGAAFVSILLPLIPVFLVIAGIVVLLRHN